jgi:hypothetical protein
LGVVDVTQTKDVSPTLGVCVAVIGNNKECAPVGITFDCSVLPLGLQSKSPRRDIVRILQRENKTLPIVIPLPGVVSVSKLPVPHPRFPLQRSETTENIPIRLKKQCQNVCVTVTSAVKVFYVETITTAPPQNRKLLLPELLEDRQNL